jgi:hypothetical protein
VRASSQWLRTLLWNERWGKGWLVATVLVALGTLARIPQLSHSLANAHSFRQTQTAMVVREYVRHGIDLRSTPLPVFGAAADVPMELPLFQALAASVAHLGLEPGTAARLTGFVSFQVAAVLLFVLVRRWHGAGAALATLALFEFVPFSLQWGTASLIDFFAVALALAMVVALDSWLQRGHASALVMGTLAAMAAFLVKSTTAPAWAFLIAISAVRLVYHSGWNGSRARIALAGIAPLAGIAAAVMWTQYADRVKSGDPLTRFLTSDALSEWNFGSLEQRMSTATWTTIGDRVTSGIAGAGVLAVALALVVLWTRSRVLEAVALAGWISVAALSPLVFTNLYVVHTYYLIAVLPALVAAVGVALAVVSRRIEWSPARERTALALGVLVTLATTATSAAGLASLSAYRYDAPVPDLATAMSENSAPTDRWIMVGCDWDPVYLYYADRTGVMFRSEDVGEFWSREPEPAAYSRIAVCSGDPDLLDYVPDGATLTSIPGPHALYVVSHSRP